MHLTMLHFPKLRCPAASANYSCDHGLLVKARKRGQYTYIYTYIYYTPTFPVHFPIQVYNSDSCTIVWQICWFRAFVPSRFVFAHLYWSTSYNRTSVCVCPGSQTTAHASLLRRWHSSWIALLSYLGINDLGIIDPCNYELHDTHLCIRKIKHIFSGAQYSSTVAYFYWPQYTWHFQPHRFYRFIAWLHYACKTMGDYNVPWLT